MVRCNSVLLSAALAAACLGFWTQAGAGQDTAAAIAADCAESNLPAASANACLARADMLAETDPSPDVQSLIAKLKQAAAHGSAAAASAPLAPAAAPQKADSGSSDADDDDADAPRDIDNLADDADADGMRPDADNSDDDSDEPPDASADAQTGPQQLPGSNSH